MSTLHRVKNLLTVSLAMHAILACCAYAMSMTFSFFCNAGGFWTQCNKKGKSAHDSIVRCLGYLCAKADLYHIILWSRTVMRKTSVVWKNVEFRTSAASSGSHVALSQLLLFVCWKVLLISNVHILCDTGGYHDSHVDPGMYMYENQSPPMWNQPRGSMSSYVSL